MSQALEGLRAYEDGNTLFYACPLTPDELEHVPINNQLQPGIRPSVPMCYNSETGLFEPHDSEAVVCAGIAVETVVFSWHGTSRSQIFATARTPQWLGMPMLVESLLE